MQSPPNVAFSPLTTERLSLRQLKTEDAVALSQLRSSEEVNKYIDRAKQTTIEEAVAFVNKINKSVSNRESFYWAINLKGETDLIGTICLWNFNDEKSRVEVGFELHPSYQGKGIMNEALSSVLQFSFDVLQLQAIDGFVHEENKASLNLLQRKGFILNPQISDPDSDKLIVYTITRENYQSIF